MCQDIEMNRLPQGNATLVAFFASDLSVILVYQETSLPVIAFIKGVGRIRGVLVGTIDFPGYKNRHRHMTKPAIEMCTNQTRPGPFPVLHYIVRTTTFPTEVTQFYSVP